MRIPHTISKNVFEAYRCSTETISLPQEQGRKIRAEDDTWDELIVPELKVLALRKLVEGWQKSSIFENLSSLDDRDMLLEMLPPDLPLEIVLKSIPYEYYWCRAAKDRWENNNPAEHGNSWRRLYCERHFSEYLENLENLESQRDECNALIKLCASLFFTLTIRSLVPSKYPYKWSEDDDEATVRSEIFLTIHHSLNVILPQLPELREIYLNFGMIYLNDGFEWRDFKFSVEDCLNLGRGIKNSAKIQKVCITRSSLDQPRVAALLQGVAVNNNIKELDLSHCKLADTGAHAVGEFLKYHRNLRHLYLTNNGIGSEGVAGIVHGLLQESATPLQSLDLRLNPLRDKGGTHICALLLRSSTLEKLNISACCLETETGMGLADVVSSDYMKILSLNLDISNNNLGFIAGEALSSAIKMNTIITQLDMRMCNFSKESEYLINQTIVRNREKNFKMQTKLEAIQSCPTIPMQVKSLIPPSKYKDLQKPHRNSIFFNESFKFITKGNGAEK
ncbi:dynein regulatory complex subunit 5 [Chelonus insularis]|uniref:dynein regulatory complex subunit 5 n=1 Tax=Chelonus insularis TaxID=460826 RepID=UPI001588F9E2|nr:dynein regulatory complex subunit 5 [Chelonus insularis]